MPAGCNLPSGVVSGSGGPEDKNLLSNRPLEGGDESGGRQKRECESEAFGKLEGKPGKSLPGEVFCAAMDSPAPASLP
jgi:hypothetical protein